MIEGLSDVMINAFLTAMQSDPGKSLDVVLPVTLGPNAQVVVRSNDAQLHIGGKTYTGKITGPTIERGFRPLKARAQAENKMGVTEEAGGRDVLRWNLTLTQPEKPKRKRRTKAKK